MIVINSVEVNNNNNSIEIPLSDILSHIYMLMEANDIDVETYFYNEALIEELGDLNETIKINLE